MNISKKYHKERRISIQFRHEVKHEISYDNMLVLRQRLKAVMKPYPYS